MVLEIEITATADGRNYISNILEKMMKKIVYMPFLMLHFTGKKKAVYQKRQQEVCMVMYCMEVHHSLKNMQPVHLRTICSMG